MSAHDSLLPGEDKPKNIRIDSTGGSMSWRAWGVLIGSFLTALAGGSGYVGFQFVTQAELSQSEKRQETRVSEVKTEVKKDIGTIKVKIGNLGGKVDRVQSYQVKQDARQEARRITERIGNRNEREEQYDRIRELNEKRLKEGKEPCATLDCLN
jgi:hypothetical protein